MTRTSGRTRRRSSSRVLTALAALTAAVAAGVSAPVVAALDSWAAQPEDHSGAQVGTDDDQLLAIASVSPWVAPNGEFQVRFDPSNRVPPDAQLTVTIHQAVDPEDGSLRTAVEEIIEEASPGRVLQTPRTGPFAELGDPAAGAVLTIPIRSGSGSEERSLLPNAGVHPVELVVTAPDGPELWSEVVFLNRLPSPPRDGERRAPLDLTLLLPLGSGPALDAGDDATFTVEEQATLGTVASLLEDARDAPLTIAARPNTLDGLTRLDDRWARELLETLGDPGTRHELLAMAYAMVDSGGLVASGERTELLHQVRLGRETVERVTGREPVTDTWVLDDTVTPAALDVLAGLGIDSLVLPSTSMDLPSDLEEADVAARPVRLEGDSGIRAVAYDGAVSARLAGTTADPVSRAHEVVTMLMATWFDAAGDDSAVGPASVVLVTPGTDARVLQALVPSLGGDGPLRADPATSPVPPLDPDAEDEEQISLTSRRTSDQSSAVRAAEDTRDLTNAYGSMAGAGDESLWAWQRVIDQSLAANIDDGRRLEMHLAVRGAVEQRVSAIEPPRSRSVLVTSRQATVPLRFRNDLPFDVTLRMRARSPRLEIDGGDTQRIVLHPGDNRFDLPITVQAPGESLLRIELSSPVPGIELEGPDIPVRSTAISGVGAALSIISVLFLIGWWIHTHRRERRNGAKLAGGHPSGSGDAGSLRPGG